MRAHQTVSRQVEADKALWDRPGSRTPGPSPALLRAHFPLPLRAVRWHL